MPTPKRGFELIAADMADYVSRTGRDALYELPSRDGMLYIMLRATTVDTKPHRRLTVSTMLPAVPTDEDLRMLRRVFAIPTKIPTQFQMQVSHEASLHTVCFEYPHDPEVQP